MKEKLGLEMPEFETISHTVASFVDDSNSLMSFSNPQEANPYLNLYFKVSAYYKHINKLQLSLEKNKVEDI